MHIIPITTSRFGPFSSKGVIGAFICSVVEPEPIIILGYATSTKASSTSKTVQIALMLRSDRPGSEQDIHQPLPGTKALCDDV